jgi:acetyl esterase/lipase
MGVTASLSELSGCTDGSVAEALRGPASHDVPGLAYGADRFQRGELMVPAGSGPHGVALVIHGGFWRARYDLRHIRPLCRALVEACWAVWNVEYRRLGNAGGGWPGTFQDVASAADHLRELAPAHGLDLARVVALGHSAGGHLALWLAARHRIPEASPLHSPDPLPLRAAVALAGVVDLRESWRLRLSGGVLQELLGGEPDTIPDRYAAASPAEMLPLGVRQVLLHGTADPIVPFRLSAAYCERALRSGDPVSLVPLAGAGHFELIAPESPEGQQVLRTMAALREE